MLKVWAVYKNSKNERIRNWEETIISTKFEFIYKCKTLKSRYTQSIFDSFGEVYTVVIKWYSAEELNAIKHLLLWWVLYSCECHVNDIQFKLNKGYWYISEDANIRIYNNDDLTATSVFTYAYMITDYKIVKSILELISSKIEKKSQDDLEREFNNRRSFIDDIIENENIVWDPYWLFSDLPSVNI